MTDLELNTAIAKALVNEIAEAEFTMSFDEVLEHYIASNYDEILEKYKELAGI